MDIDDTDADRALVATERFQHKLRHPERVLLSKHVKVMVILVWCVCVRERERERERVRECVCGVHGLKLEKFHHMRLQRFRF